ncbi:hypothetical protein [Bacillus velezensis]|uniref:hypothetical protein n=1 Tax=Bacillus velezensis TaxID=492670 RepID=UPI002FBED564
MKCAVCEGTGYATWFEDGRKFYDKDIPCVDCFGKGEIGSVNNKQRIKHEYEGIKMDGVSVSQVIM